MYSQLPAALKISFSRARHKTTRVKSQPSFAICPSSVVYGGGYTLHRHRSQLAVFTLYSCAPEVDRSRSALELPVSCAETAPSDAACTPVPAMTAPPADVFASAIMAANAVCFFPELTKAPHVLEPSTTSSRCGAKPPRDALESKVQVSMPALTDSASQSLGADATCLTMNDVATARLLATQREPSSRERYANAQSALPHSPN